MSDQFAKNNDEKSIELFYKKFNYSFTVDDKQGTLNNVKDFFNAEKLLYGRVDRNYVPIVVARNVTPAAVIASRADEPVSAHPFVAEAFREMRTQAQKALGLGQLNTSGEVSFLASLAPVRGHQNHYKLYSQHINSIMIGAKSAWNKDNVKFSNFDEFIASFLPAIEELTATLPYTLPAFIKHRICPITVSGLAIEISADDSSKDADKVSRFLNDPNWPYYVNLCRSYGFSIDKNVPWRLVADIATNEMLEYAKKYGYYNTDAILGTAFEPVHSSYFPQFISFIEKAYDYLRMENYVEVDVCRYSELKPKIIIPKKYAPGELLQKYGEEYFLRLYLKIRIMEMEENLPQHIKEKLIRDTINQYFSGSRSAAIGAFEKVIATTYTNSGSLTKRIEGGKLREEEAFQEDELQGAVSTYR